MTILSSQIEMNAKSSKESSMQVQVNAIHNFKQDLLQLRQKESSKEIHVLNVETNMSEITNNEQNLSIKDYVQKFLIEIIMQTFLKKDEKQKLFPIDGSCMCMKKEQNDQNNQSSTDMPDIDAIKSSFKFESTIEYYSKTTIDFKSSIAVTSNDKTINIDLDISFTQEFYEKHNTMLSYEEMVVLDPLVINYGNDDAGFDSLSNMSFEFDLNNDGEMNNIPILKEGIGYLALDKNNNNKIDNGSELFGPSTNLGFEELRAYDEDGNNFIDENDSVYKNLKIWSKSSEKNELITLSHADIGAIYLNDITSSFEYKKDLSNSIAQLQSSSIFINNEGTKAGIVSALNFKA